MKKGSKQILIILIAILISSVASVTLAATTGSVVLNSDKQQYNPGDTVVVSVNFSNFHTDGSAVEFGGKIQYSEGLELEEVTTNRDAGWDAVAEGNNFKKETGGFSFGAGAVNPNSKVFDIKLKVKSNFTGTAKPR